MRKLIEGGFYRHWKSGQPYRAHRVVVHSETLEEYVLYETLYENPRGRFWIRPLKMFLEEIEHEGRRQPRFAEATEPTPSSTDAS